ncbi:hypothetical protein, partial [Mesomycoplasma ovipneumoniae]|uniref:hypothetical protein n=1 Tax=Mesomycoplasma ovipneumoniae TaxID=29562 RepID=UPI003CC807DF
PAEPHTSEDDFAHFLSYSGLSAEPAAVIDQLRLAFAATWAPRVMRDASAHTVTVYATRMFEALSIQRAGLIAERDALQQEVDRLRWRLTQHGE